MQKRLISVIIPVYNVEKYLNRCVNSVLEQSYDNIEIILVDDGSTDSSCGKCDDYKKYGVKVIHQDNQGLSAARNAGMKIAAGEYIMFLDSDDWIERDLLRQVVLKLEEDDSDICFFDWNIIYDNMCIPRNMQHTKYPPISTFSSQECFAFLFEHKIENFAVMYVAKKELYTRNSVTFPVGKYYEDIFTTYKLIGGANRISYINNRGYFYYQRKDSIVHEVNYKKMNDYLDALEMMRQYVDDKYLNLRNKSAAYVYMGYIETWCALKRSEYEYNDKINEFLGKTKVSIKDIYGIKSKAKYLLYRLGILNKVYNSKIIRKIYKMYALRQ